MQTINQLVRNTFFSKKRRVNIIPFLVLTIFFLSCKEQGSTSDIQIRSGQDYCEPITNQQATEIGEGHNEFIYDHYVPMRDAFHEENCDPCFSEYKNYLDTAQTDIDFSQLPFSQTEMATYARDILIKADSLDFDFANMNDGNNTLSLFYNDINLILDNEDRLEEWDSLLVNLQDEYIPNASCVNETIIKGVISVTRHSTCLWSTMVTDSLSRVVMSFNRTGMACVRATIEADAVAASFFLESQAIGMAAGWVSVPGVGGVTFAGFVGMGSMAIGGASAFMGIREWWNGPGGNGGPAPIPTSNEDCPPN